MNRRVLIIGFCVAVMPIILGSCKYFVAKDDKPVEDGANGSPVASVGDKYLYEQDLKGLFNDHTQGDSAEIMQHYIDSWIKRQLMLTRAEQNLSMTEELEQKVEDYRYQLIVYEYQKKYINEKLNTEVSPEEIKKYYKENKDNFELKENIVRCHFLQIPKEANNLSKAKSWFRSSQPKNYEKLKEYGKEYALNQSYEDSVWYLFDDVVKNTPLQSIPNKTNYLRHHKHIEASDSSYVYLLKINEYKISNEISPLQFVEDKIRNIIINQRKTKLIRELEQGIYANAKEKKLFKIYN